MGTTDNKAAVIAMSGGVDSSVAAYLMLQARYRCVGATMRLYTNAEIGLNPYHTCCSQQDVDDAAEVCFDLDIPHHVIDYTEAFKTAVIDKFVRVYEAGGAPNPCIDCNRYMKFSHLIDFADEQGCRYVVTGHYARVEWDSSTGRYVLRRAADAAKDQSYVLYMLTQDELARVQFPLGMLTKPEVRHIAEEQGFVNARKHDSQDICFVPDGDYSRFIEHYRQEHFAPGDVLDEEGRVIGRHRGAICYTLGQRKGIGVAMGKPAYVVAKDMQANTVTLGPEESLMRSHLLAEDVNWVSIAAPAVGEPLRVAACTRYHQRERACTATLLPDGLLQLDFDEPQRAMTPGQAVVLYRDDLVLGGGTIRETF